MTQPREDVTDRDLPSLFAVMAGSGDRWAWRQLLDMYRPLIGRTVRRYARASRSLTSEDLEQEAALALLVLARYFDPSKGLRFTGFVISWLPTEIRRALDEQDEVIRAPVHAAKSNRRGIKAGSASMVPQAFSVDSVTRQTDEGDPEQGYDQFAASGGDLTLSAAQRIQLADMIGTLPPALGETVARYFINGEDSGEISRDLGISKQAVDQRLKKAIKLLRQQISGEKNASCVQERIRDRC